MSIPLKLKQLLDEYRSLPDQDSRADFLIDLASTFEEVPARLAQRPFSKEHQVPACESEAYVWAERGADGLPKLYFAVENPQGISAKALAVILDSGCSGTRVEEILAVPEDLVIEIFGQGISMGKGAGLRSMVGMVKGLVARLK